MSKRPVTNKLVCYCGDAFSEYQKEQIRRSVCRNLPVKYVHMNQEYCIFHYPSVDKKEKFGEALYERISRGDYLFYGTWFPDEVDFTAHNFNKWADFMWVTFNNRVNFKNAKFSGNCDFTCATFKAATSFHGAIFSKDATNDLSTRFYSATFEDIVDFSAAKFQSRVEFQAVKFLVGNSSFVDPTSPTYSSSFYNASFEEEADFAGAVFGKPKKESHDSFSFGSTKFKELANFHGADFLISTDFSKAVFKKIADFRDTRIKTGLSFDGASFEGFGKFSGKDNKHSSWSKDGLNFTSVDIEKSEKISFQGVKLKPDSFINTDVRKFDFTDVEWKKKNFAFDWSRFKYIRFWKDEAKKGESNYERLGTVYRRLATNAAENARYEEASDFRFTAFDIQRIKRSYGRLPVTLLWWYKWTSRYGENWGWAAIVLLAILTAFAALYSDTPFYICPLEKPISQSISEGLCTIRSLDIYEAARHSLATATFQNVDYRRPASGVGEVFVLLEKILAPLQAALLALAIRRKFMS
jgi:uncharacterized protein YjbI with pentapeptide repeats